MSALAGFWIGLGIFLSGACIAHAVMAIAFAIRDKER
jgi:hypothetical protein